LEAAVELVFSSVPCQSYSYFLTILTLQGELGQRCPSQGARAGNTKINEPSRMQDKPITSRVGM
jgi:hypothetical protein